MSTPDAATGQHGSLPPPAFPGAGLDPDATQALVEAWRGMTTAERAVVAVEGDARAELARHAADAAARHRTLAGVGLAFLAGWVLGGVFVILCVHRARRPTTASVGAR